MSLCIDDRLVCRTSYPTLNTKTVIYTEWHITGVVLQLTLLMIIAHGCPKHVENRNKHTWKDLCVKLVIYKDYTEIHGQQNTKTHVYLTRSGFLFLYSCRFSSLKNRAHLTFMFTAALSTNITHKHIIDHKLRYSLNLPSPKAVVTHFSQTDLWHVVNSHSVCLTVVHNPR
jgi:hypothetical protein